MPETKDLILRHAVMEDWKGMYHNLWCHPESAKYMLWDVTTSEADAISRMERSIRFQEGKTVWFVYEKKSGEPIGFAGVQETAPGIFEETGIALGPDYVGRGYGKQLLNCLCTLAKDMGGHKMTACCRSQNLPSKGMILSCGFAYTHEETKTDPRNNENYRLLFFEKAL